MRQLGIDASWHDKSQGSRCYYPRTVDENDRQIFAWLQKNGKPTDFYNILHYFIFQQTVDSNEGCQDSPL
jgi:hypothetical protein